MTEIDNKHEYWLTVANLAAGYANAEEAKRVTMEHVEKAKKETFPKTTDKLRSELSLS